ncbi:Retrovirus-related Pol polyprotein from transposon RE1, partial [Bienertia sinuspersici]
ESQRRCSQLDPDLVSAVAQQMMKMLGDKQSGSSSKGNGNTFSANFAGKVYASNAVSFNNNENFEYWLIDSGASDHMAGNISLFSDLKEIRQGVNVKKIGTLLLNPKLKLENVLYIPDFQHNLLSISKIIQSGNAKVIFDESGCYFQDPLTDEKVMCAREHEGVYVFKPENAIKKASQDSRINKNGSLFCNVKTEK